MLRFAVLAVLLSGCAIRAATPDKTIPALTSAAKVAAAVPADPSAGCANGEGSPEGWLSMRSGGWQRRYLLRLPKDAKPHQPMPLVLNFPGWTETARMHEKYTFMTPAAQARGMALVYPQGISESFNAGDCCGRAANEGIDDVQFVTDLVERLERELCIDRNRIYATGISNGGMLSYRLACEMSDVFAAVAPVAAAEAVEKCEPSRPVPVLAFNGKWDLLVWYGGGPLFPSAPESVARWSRRNGCDAPPGEVTYARGDAECRVAKGCKDDADVALCTISTGGHTWPGAAIVPALGHTSSDLDATDVMLDFFLAHPRR